MTLDGLHRIKAVDLFCGAGGLSLGLHRSGIGTVLAIDNFQPAIETYGRNFGGTARLETISSKSDIPPCDIVVGGPPCQGFSSAGQRRTGDDRNSLVSVFASLVSETRPQAFVFENVEGFLTTERGDRVLDLLLPLVETGYQIHVRKINAANYGVPQHRKRVIAIGGLGWDPGFPEITHFAYGAPGAHLIGSGLPRTLHVAGAFVGLPEAVQEIELPGLSDHYFRPLSDQDMARAKVLGQGERMRDLPGHLQHDSYTRRANRRVMDGTASERRGGAPAGVRRLIAEEPSKAITSGARSELLHPMEDRYLTLRECARLQSFPDDFRFVGSASDRAILIGNAVPPLLGEIIGKHLIHHLRNRCRQGGAGKLLSFVPTLSTGMSPALQNTCGRVKAAFPEFFPGAHERQLQLWS